MGAGADAVLRAQPGIQDRQEDLYRDLHAHPELGHQETHTAGLVAAGLTSLGFELHARVGGTGVVGVLTNGDGPVVLVRADMDALPVPSSPPWP